MARNRFRPVLLLAGILAALAPAATAQFGFESADKASSKLFVRVEGNTVRTALRVEVEEHWHLYHVEKGPEDAIGQETVVTFDGEGVTWSAPWFPEPTRYEQPGLGAGGRDTWIWGHEGRFFIYGAGVAEGELDPSTVTASIDAITCLDDGSCIPYYAEVANAGAGPDAVFADFPADLAATAAAATAPAASDSESAATGATATGSAGSTGPPTAAGPVAYSAVEFPEFEPVGDEANHGLGMWLLLAFVAGMILNVMPCVLPVISIKVLSFVQQAGEDRKRILQLGLAFAAGILLVFLVLAGLAIGLGLGWGEQFQSAEFLIVMIGIVFAMALSLFGLFELGVPTQVGALAGGGVREGLGDAFFKGMLATVLATPCSGPFLGSTLAWTLQQSSLTIFLVFLMLGLGMALPYVVLTANPAFLKIVPRPGPWMETFKHAMGFVLLATVVYLMISLQQDMLLFTVGFLVFVALGCWWYGRFSTFDKSRGKRWAHLAAALLIVAGGARFTFGTFRGFFSPVAAQGDHVAWVDFEPDQFLAHLDAGRSVFVDFTADWCPNCKYNEKFVYESDEIRALLEQKGVVPMKADITHKNDYTDMVNRLYKGRLGGAAIPFMAVFPGDDPARPHTRPDIVTIDDLSGILRTLPEPPR